MCAREGLQYTTWALTCWLLLVVLLLLLQQTPRTYTAGECQQTNEGQHAHRACCGGFVVSAVIALQAGCSGGNGRGAACTSMALNMQQTISLAERCGRRPIGQGRLGALPLLRAGPTLLTILMLFNASIDEKMVRSGREARAYIPCRRRDVLEVHSEEQPRPTPRPRHHARLPVKVGHVTL